MRPKCRVIIFQGFVRLAQMGGGEDCGFPMGRDITLLPLDRLFAGQDGAFKLNAKRVF